MRPASSTSSSTQVNPLYNDLRLLMSGEEFKRALKLAPKLSNNDSAQAMRAYALIRLDKLCEAVEVVETLLQRRKDKDALLTEREPFVFEGYFSKCLQQLGMTKQEITHRTAILQKNPGNALNGKYLIEALILDGNMNDAQMTAMKLYKATNESQFIFTAAALAACRVPDGASSSDTSTIQHFTMAQTLLTKSKSPSQERGVAWLRLHTLMRLNRVQDAYEEMSAATTTTSPPLTCEQLVKRAHIAMHLDRQDDAVGLIFQALELDFNDWAAIRLCSRLAFTSPPIKARLSDMMTKHLQQLSSNPSIQQRGPSLALISCEFPTPWSTPLADGGAHLCSALKRHLTLPNILSLSCTFSDVRNFLLPFTLALATTASTTRERPDGPLPDLTRVCPSIQRLPDNIRCKDQDTLWPYESVACKVDPIVRNDLVDFLQQQLQQQQHAHPMAILNSHRMLRFLGEHEKLIHNKPDTIKMIRELLHQAKLALDAQHQEAYVGFRMLAAYILIDCGTDGDYMAAASILIEARDIVGDTCNHQVHLLLHEIFSHRLGAAMLGAIEFDRLAYKHIQRDSLGFIGLSTGATFGRYDLQHEHAKLICQAAVRGVMETNEAIVNCFMSGNAESGLDTFRLLNRLRSSHQLLISRVEKVFMFPLLRDVKSHWVFDGYDMDPRISRILVEFDNPTMAMEDFVPRCHRIAAQVLVNDGEAVLRDSCLNSDLACMDSFDCPFNTTWEQEYRHLVHHGGPTAYVSRVVAASTSYVKTWQERGKIWVLARCALAKVISATWKNDIETAKTWLSKARNWFTQVVSLDDSFYGVAIRGLQVLIGGGDMSSTDYLAFVAKMKALHTPRNTDITAGYLAELSCHVQGAYWCSLVCVLWKRATTGDYKALRIATLELLQHVQKCVMNGATTTTNDIDLSTVRADYDVNMDRLEQVYKDVMKARVEAMNMMGEVLGRLDGLGR